MRTAQLQIRVTPAEKATIELAARRAGLGMSAYVLARVLPAGAARWQALAREIARSRGAKIAFAELSGWLSGLSARELKETLAVAPPAALAEPLANTVAAMVEHACASAGVAPPAWTADIAPLARPVFGSNLASLRLHLLANSPPAFRRRNLFVDTAVGGQV
jgi:hypothetical protein